MVNFGDVRRAQLAKSTLLPSGGPSYPNPLSSPPRPVNQIHSLHLHADPPGIFSVLLRSVHMQKREWVVESNWKLPHLSIPSKIAVWVPEFAVKYGMGSSPGDVGKATSEGLENGLSFIRQPSVASLTPQHILQTFRRRFIYVTGTSPTSAGE